MWELRKQSIVVVLVFMVPKFLVIRLNDENIRFIGWTILNYFEKRISKLSEENLLSEGECFVA